MKIKRITFIFCSIVLAALSGCIETPDASQFYAPTISVSAASPAQASVTIVCQLSKGAHPAKITFRLSKSQSMSDAIETTVPGGVGESYSASFSGLEEGTQYYFDAEASGGRSSCRSSVGTFKTADAFDIDKDTKQINYQQQYVEFEVVSSIGLSVQIEDGADWVRESDTKATTKYRKSFLVDYNSSVEDRTATIVFKSATGGETRTVRIFQAGGPIMIPDKNFKAYLVENFDKDGDGEIVLDEAKVVKEISTKTKDMVSLQGIEYFSNLQTLSVWGSWDSNEQKYKGLQQLDVSNNTALTYLSCYSNQLSSLDVSNNTALTYLSCYSNQLSSLDVSNSTALTSLYCGSNQLSSLDVSNSTALTSLYCGSNQLSSLDVGKNTALEYLDCGSNQLSSLDVSNNTSLTELSCYNNQLSSLDVSNNTALTYLYCYSNQLSSLDVRNNTALTYLSCYGNQLSSLDVSNNTSLTRLYCDNNQLSSLDVSNNTALTDLSCDSNQLSSLDVSNNTALTSLYCSWNQMSSLDVSSNTLLHSLSCSSNKPLTVYLTTGQYIENISKNENVTLVYGGDKINIPDANFKNYLVRNFDSDGDGEISYTEGLDITYINVGTNNIMSLQGIECFPNLKTLYAYGSWDNDAQKKDGKLTELDVSNNTALTYLDCHYNQLSSLDVSNNTALTSLDCGSNQLSSLDVSNNTALTSLYCGWNQLSSLDVRTNTALTSLNCYGNQLSSLDVSNNTALTYLDCYGNQLSSLDVSNNTALTSLNCYGNQLSSLDVSNNTALTSLYCYYNQYLREIWLKSGQVIANFNYDSNVATIKYK